MKLKKGAALPGAIILCFMLLIITYAVGASILQMVANNKVQQFQTTQKEIFETSYEEFLLNYSKTDISDETYTWETSSDTIDAKEYVVLAAYQNDELAFYAIYNKTESKTVAYQTSNFYIVDNKLGGLLEIVRS